MISIITDLQDPLLEFVRDDPIRPEISKEFRVARNRFVSVLIEDTPKALLCVNLLDRVPADVSELGDTDHPDTAVFYTIWSYAPGAGVRVLRETVAEIKQRYPTVKRFVTLSPKTVVARRFHLKNGAIILRDNSNTVNYEYLV